MEEKLLKVWKLIANPDITQYYQQNNNIINSVYDLFNSLNQTTQTNWIFNNIKNVFKNKTNILNDKIDLVKQSDIIKNNNLLFYTFMEREQK